MRVAHRRGVVEGVVIGAAVAGSRRPAPVVAVPAAYPAYYAVPPAAVAVGVSTPMPPPPGVVVNTAPPMQSYYPPPPPGAYAPPPAAAAAYPPMPPPPAMAPPPPYASPAPTAPVVLPPAAMAAGKGPSAAAVAGIEAAAVVKAVERRHFLIVNEANGSLLEVQRGNVKPNSLVVADKRRPDRPGHQIWYMDVDGIIRSKITDFAMESKNVGERLRMVPYTGDARQKWTVRGNRIVNDVFCNDCISLKKGIIRLKDDADVIVTPYEGKPFQHWRVEYL